MILPVMREAPVLDYSAASTLHSCGRKYLYQYEDRLRPKGGEPPYLLAGTAMHSALESLYTVAWDLTGALEALRAAWGSYEPPKVGKHAYLTLGHLEICLQNYFEDRSERPTALESAVIGESGRESAEEALVFDWKGLDGRVLRVGGKIDLPTTLANEKRIVDHKCTTGWLNAHWHKERFALGHQFRVYCAAMREMTGQVYEGAYVNAVYIGEKAGDAPKAWKTRQSVPNGLFGPMNFTPEMLDETWAWLRDAHDLREFYRARGSWPQNEAACGNFGGCAYLELCERTPMVRKAIAASRFERWEPTGLLASGADGSKRV